MVHPTVTRISTRLLQVLRATPSHTWLLSCLASLLIFLVASTNRAFGTFFSRSDSPGYSPQDRRGEDYCTTFPERVIWNNNLARFWGQEQCIDEFYMLAIMQMVALPVVGCLLILALPAAWCGILRVQYGVPVSSDSAEAGGATGGTVLPESADVALTVAGAGLTRFKSFVTRRSLRLTFPLAILLAFSFIAFAFLNIEMFHIRCLFLLIAPFVLVMGTLITRVLRLCLVLPGPSPRDYHTWFRLVNSLNERNMIAGALLGIVGWFVAFAFLHWGYILNLTLLAIFWTGLLVGFEVVFESLGRNLKAVLIPLQIWLCALGLLAFFIIMVADRKAFSFVQVVIMMVLTVLPVTLLVLLFYVALRLLRLTNDNPLLTCYMVSIPTVILFSLALFISPYEHATREYVWFGVWGDAGYYEHVFVITEMPFSYYSCLVVVMVGWMLFFFNGYREVTARVREVYPGGLNTEEMVPTPLISKADLDSMAVGDAIAEGIGKAILLCVHVAVVVGRKCAPGLRIQIRRSNRGQIDGDYFMFDRELEDRPVSRSSPTLISASDQRAPLPGSDGEDLEVVKV